MVFALSAMLARNRQGCKAWGEGRNWQVTQFQIPALSCSVVSFMGLKHINIPSELRFFGNLLNYSQCKLCSITLASMATSPATIITWYPDLSRTLNHSSNFSDEPRSGSPIKLNRADHKFILFGTFIHFLLPTGLILDIYNCHMPKLPKLVSLPFLKLLFCYVLRKTVHLRVR